LDVPVGLEVLALADDLTGALEVGAEFANDGVRALVVADPETGLGALPEAEAVVIDTESRHLGATQAMERVARWASSARRRGIRFIYKKTDSTLRGNIGQEFEALLESFPDRPLVYVPAYPKLGRTVAGGDLYVDGRPLAETAFSGDPLNPSRESSIPALLGRQCRAPILSAPGSGELRRLLERNPAGAVIVCDGTTEEDLRAVAAVLDSAPVDSLAAGPGGFAAWWIRSLPVPRCVSMHFHRPRRCLVVNGSLHPASRAQVFQAQQGGMPAFFLAPDAAAGDTVIEAVARAVTASGWAIVSTSGTLPAPAPEVAGRLGFVAARVLRGAMADGLVVFGGDTAHAVLRSLGASVLRPRGELLPGIPLSLFSFEDREAALLTKAGGFGSAGVLLAIRQCWEDRT